MVTRTSRRISLAPAVYGSSGASSRPRLHPRQHLLSPWHPPTGTLAAATKVMWSSGCQIGGHLLKEVVASSNLCGNICTNDASCVHWTWTAQSGGTCFMKDGGASRESQLSGAGCGFVVGRFFDPSVPVVTSKPTLPPPTLAPVTKTPAPVNGPTSDETKEMLNFISTFRLSNNLPPLKINNLLMRATTEHAKDQTNQCTLSHKGSDGSTPLLRAARNGYKTKMVWENIAVGKQAMSGILDP